MAHDKDGFDSHKRWGNSGIKGHGVNSPAMMEARKGFDAKKKELAERKKNAGGKYATKSCAYHGNKNCSRCD